MIALYMSNKLSMSGNSAIIIFLMITRRLSYMSSIVFSLTQLGTFVKISL